MVDRSDIGKRLREKALKKINIDKERNPEKYRYSTSEKSIYLGLKYDMEQGNLHKSKVELYNKLKKEYGDSE